MGAPEQTRARDFTLGVEEEYQIVDPQTFGLAQRAEPLLSNAAMSGGGAHPELNLSQVEISTVVCNTLDEVRSELVRSRKELRVAAEAVGVQIAAAGTHPFSHWLDQNVTPTSRYLAMERDYAQLVREHIVFGFHVHVGIGGCGGCSENDGAGRRVASSSDRPCCQLAVLVGPRHRFCKLPNRHV